MLRGTSLRPRRILFFLPTPCAPVFSRLTRWGGRPIRRSAVFPLITEKRPLQPEKNMPTRPVKVPTHQFRTADSCTASSGYDFLSPFERLHRVVVHDSFLLDA